MHARVTAVLDDGSKITSEGEFAPLADRVAFERRFGMTAAVLSRLKDAFDAEGNMMDSADASEIREEHLAFVIWRMLRREHELGEFDEFIERAVDLDFVDLAAEAAERGEEIPEPPFGTPTAPPT